MLRYLGTTLAAALILALSAAGASAAPPSPANPAGKLLGVVPSHHQATKFSRAGSNLSYHNGPVMHTNTVYAIYWVPGGSTVSGSYQSLINGYFGNLSATPGATTNVYYADTQYYDTINGHILDSSTVGGTVVDTNPFPPNGCNDPYTSVCLSDSQLQTELHNVMVAHNWSGGTGNLFLIFTPKGVGSCAGSSCAFSYYCAYHSWIGSGTGATLYANMPYADTVPSACDSGQDPNGDPAADSEISLISHEHNESITDPTGNAWYDSRGNEDGDKCAWNFGSSLGSTATGRYNQVINGADYYLQQEWSNHSSGCVLQGT